MWRKTLSSLLAFATTVILLAGCSNSKTKTTKPGEYNRVTRVKVQKVESTSLGESQSYVGTVEASVSIPLSFLTNGTAEKVFVSEGQFVKKGQLLAVLDNESYRNIYQAALAKEEQAQDAYNRMEPLYKKGSLPAIKYVQVKTGLEQARSSAKVARKQLKNCKLYAPADGYIGKKIIEPGMSVIPDNTVFKLVKINKINVNVPIPENQISAIKKGEPVSIQVAALDNRKYAGKVTEIGVLANPLSHTYMIKVELPNPGNALKPGMICQVDIRIPSLSNRILVPMSAIQIQGNGQKFVYVADPVKNIAVHKDVTIGEMVNDDVVIKSGLSKGALLITEGYQKINDGSSIKIIK